MSFDDFKARRHFGSLDGLRALSILGVVWHHAARSNNLFFAEQGANGVPLFFAVSGFLITSLLLRERESRMTISLRHFYARRSLRIFPLYYAVLALYVALVLVKDRETRAGVEFVYNLRYYATYTSNWFVRLEGRVIFYFAWSLATEEQFYLAWPSVEKWLPRGAVAAALGLCLLQAAVGADLISLTQGSLTRIMIVSVQPAICLGVVLAHVLHDRQSFKLAERMLGSRFASLFFLLAMLIALWLNAAQLLVHTLMVLLVGACVMSESHALAHLLRFGPIQSIGKVSYGIYLLHLLVINGVERVLFKLGSHNHLVVFLFSVPAAWALALLSYKYFESHFLRLKGRFARVSG